jgi:glucan phosphoethanolaminetransferase (alkaline phosphatase superfamily)
VESGLEYLGIYCISYIVVTALASALCFVALKTGGENAEKQFRNGYSIVAIVFIALVIILLVAIRKGII